MRRPNMKSAFVRIVVSLALTLLLAHAALSWQVSYGLQPFGSFSGGPFDIVNNQDLNVHFAIPVLNKAGRGLPFNYSDGYDSTIRSEEHTSELQSRGHLVCRLLLEKKKNIHTTHHIT